MIKEGGEDKYNTFLAYKESERKVRVDEDRINKMKDEMRQKFPKHLYDSTEEESDYEITEKDLHPVNHRAGK